MFNSPFSAQIAGQRRFAGAYQQVAVQTSVSCATPHQLISLLFDAFFTALHRARGAMQRKDVAAKGAAIAQAVRIVDEGLKAGLDVKAGGRLASDLAELYAYVSVRLTQANLHNDEAALAECERLVQPLSQAWSAIGQRPEVTAQS